MGIDVQLHLLRTWRAADSSPAPGRTTPGLRREVSSQAARSLDTALRSRRGERAGRAGGGLFTSNEVAPI